MQVNLDITKLSYKTQNRIRLLIELLENKQSVGGKWSAHKGDLIIKKEVDLK